MFAFIFKEVELLLWHR